MPVNEQRHAQRRDAILQEAYRQFAQAGYDRTTTATICRAAGISSGTFFHYFPTKLDALIGVLAAGVSSTRQALAAIEASGVEAVLAYAAHLEEEIADPDFAGFVHALAGVEQLPAVAAVLREEAELVEGFLTRELAVARGRGEVRADVEPAWVQWLLDGAAMGKPGSGDVVRAVRALIVG